MSEHKKSGVAAVRSAEVAIPPSSSMIEISIGGSNLPGGGFTTGAGCWCEYEADMVKSKLEEG